MCVVVRGGATTENYTGEDTHSLHDALPIWCLKFASVVLHLGFEVKVISNGKLLIC